MPADRRPPCAALVVVRVPGCTPPSSFRRPCKRYACPGSAYCRTHADLDEPEPIQLGLDGRAVPWSEVPQPRADE